MALRELLAEFGIEVDTKKLDHANEKIEGFIEKAKKVAGTVAAAFAVKEVYEFAEGVAHTLDYIDDQAHALGISTDAVQTWGFAARAAGDDAGELLNMMGRLQVTASGKAGGPGAEAFKQLGVSAKDASGKVKDADELFGDVAEGFKKMEDPAKRAAIATELFGRGGRKLLPFLVEGREGVEKMRKEFAELGGGFDEEAIQKGGEFEHAMAKVGVVVDGLKGALVKGLFPVLAWIADKAALIGGWFVRMSKNTHLFRNALLMLGAYLTPLAIQMAIAFAPVLLAGAAIAAIVILFDDLFTMFEGGQSVIGETLDKIFGKGASTEVVNQFKLAWTQTKDIFSELSIVIKPIWEFLKYIVEHADSWTSWGQELGDWAAKVDIRNLEEHGMETHLLKKTRTGGGLSAEENVGARDAQAYMEAQLRNEDMTKWRPPEISKGKTAEEVMPNIMAWVKAIQGDQTGTYARFRPETYGPLPEPVAAGNVTVNVQGSTDMKAPELRKVVADGVNDARQKANRDAKHVLTQAAPK